MTKRLIWGARGAALLSTTAFVWLFVQLGGEGALVRKEQFIYLPYAETQDELVRQQAERVSWQMEPAVIEGDLCRYRLSLSTGVGGWSRVERVGLDLYFPGPMIEILGAELTLFGGGEDVPPLRFVAAAGALAVGEPLVLERRKADAAIDRADRLEALLVVTTCGPSALSAVVQLSSGQPHSQFLWLRVGEGKVSPAFATLSGWFQNDACGIVPLSRLELLAATWNLVERGTSLLRVILLVAAALWTAGICLALWPRLFALPPAFIAALASSLLAAGLFSVVAVITPPFHGPDEVDHYLAFAKASRDRVLFDGALGLANTGHFERISRRASEHFLASDVGAPRDDKFASSLVPPDPGRSPWGEFVWSALDRLVSPKSAGQALMMLRLTNVGYICLSLFVAVICAAGAARPASLLPWVLWPALLPPTVAFYSSMVSNYPYLIGAYLLQAAALTVLWRGVRNACFSVRVLPTAGLLAGVGTALAVSSSDNGAISPVLWSIVFPCYFYGLRVEMTWPSVRRNVVRLLAPFCTSLALVWLAIASITPEGFFLPATVRRAVGALLLADTSTTLFCLLAVFVYSTALYAGCVLAAAVGQRKACSGRCSAKVRAGFAGIGLVALGFLAFSNAAPVPDLSLPGGDIHVLPYMVRVLHAFADSMAPGNSDPMVATSFWSLLGWHEFQLPRQSLHFLRFSAGLGVAILFFGTLSRSSFPRPTVFFFAAVAGVLACLVLLAAVYHCFSFNFNSRYLLGVYIFWLALAGEGLRRAWSRQMPPAAGRAMAWSGFLVVVASLHAVMWTVILERYF